jgi:phosphomannomutase
MVTGSHIPAGRNGLKFFGPLGEITKADEAAIAAGAGAADGSAGAEEAVPFDAVTPYLARYTGFFAADALGGLRVGVFEQSTVAREILRRVLEALGAEVVAFGRSEAFVAVDTEAVDAGMRALIRDAAEAQGLDAVVSADGDGDRPLLADGSGEILAGDILGALTAMALGADTVVTPVSSNTLIERSGAFRRVVRTRIGSPYVIAGMEAAAPCRPAGFEANGGFLLGFKAERAGRTLEPLPTRDAVLPILSALALARERGGVGRLLEGLPPRRTAADRLADVPGEASRALVAALAADRAARARFFAGFGPEDWTDLTDGLRIGFGGGLILHLRPSGNAPELRVHAEADGADLAARAMREAMARVAARLGRERG